MHQLKYLLALMIFVPQLTHAQSYQCRAPSLLNPAPPERKPASEPRRVKTVTGYTLALSWSPEFCRTRKNNRRHKTQCSGDDGSFAFILHGLWPETRGPAYPQWCRATRALPVPVIKRNFCMMPTAKLMAHEWAKHGTCMTRRPQTYFRISRVLFDAVQYPNMDRLSRKPLTAGQLRNAFAATNEGLGPDMMRLKVNQRGWLQEVKLCLGKNFRPRKCPAHLRAVKPDRAIKIWRGA
ncbi:Ribonuclease T2 family protein [hydrothermal vent metagenome]|uniref:Ribonuclease T2 family protein n=1 Tax=hydrothermal vent metagenome TaxID=652676 RepID=A0A3B0SDS9_9ZZZZ